MKKNTVYKLTIRELITLDNFFKHQSSDMSLVKAHGFITAVASFPEMHMPSEWIPILVGELRAVNDQAPVSIILEKLVNLYKQITYALDSEKKFEFIFSSFDPTLNIENASFESIQEWCNGYCLALVWNEEAWLNVKEEYISKACTTFFMLTELINAAANDNMALEWEKDKQMLISNLPQLVKALYNYWMGKHKSNMLHEMHNIRYSKCPCGSQKPYQNCCLLEASDAILH